jgi:hypothetical protein
LESFENFDEIPKDSVNTKSEKHIGTIAPDLFQNKILIIDYVNKRICNRKLPQEYSNATLCRTKPKKVELKFH